MKTSEKISLLKTNPREFVRLALNRVSSDIEGHILDLLRPEKSEIINDIDLRFLGMRRSGNHAIIDWFIRSVLESRNDAKHVFLNNINAKMSGYRQRYLTPEPDSYRRAGLTRMIAPRRWRKFSQLDLLVRSYEDHTVEYFYPPEPQKYYGASRIRRNYVILRDPLNLLASRRKAKMTATREGLSEIDLYLNHAKLLDQPKDEIRIVLYNLWLIDPEYRSGLAQDLGVAPAALSAQPTRHGGGSSFSGIEREVQKNELLNRWLLAADQGVLDDAIDHKGIQRVIKDYFPEISSTSLFRPTR